MAVTCVTVLPGSSSIGKSGTTNVTSLPTREFVVVDPTCASGMVIMSQDDLKLTVVPEALDVNRVADMQALFIAFVAVLVSVWGLKQLLRLFTSDTERD